MTGPRGSGARRGAKRAPPVRRPSPSVLHRAAGLGPRGAPPPAGRAVTLPQHAGPIIGRAAEVADARQWLLRAYVRLLTFTGPAGVGKTRLALEVAGSLRDAFEHGVYFIDLSALGDPALVLPTIAQVLQVRELPGRPLRERLAHSLADRRLLLVLDNFEHLVAAAPEVAELLAVCPDLKLLITSREVLRVSWEQEFPVAPLGLPDLKRFPPLETLGRVPAVEFFVTRARTVSPTFTLTPHNARPVAELCINLDGLPLAIALAAVGIKALSPEAILARLRDRLQVLTTGLRDLPARQRTLRAAMDWSHELLTVPERALLRRLAVFAGGFTLEAAEAASAGVEGAAGQILDLLSRLADKSLLSRADFGRSPRYRMLEIVRRHAEDKLNASGEEAAARAWHLNWCLDLAERAEPELQGPEQRDWLDRLEQEHDNLRAALSWSLQSGHIEGALRLSGALWGFWYVRGYWTEGHRWLDAALAEGNGAGRALRAKAMNAVAVLTWAQGDYQGAAARCEEGIALCRAIDDRAGLAFSLNLLGLVMRHRGDYGRATEMLEESLALRRELGDTSGIASSLSSLGIVASYRGDYAKATRFYEESLTLRRRLEDRGGIAECFYFLGIIMFHQGDRRRAAEYFEQGLALFRELGDRAGTASTLTNLGMLAQYHGEAGRAARLYGESLVLRYDLGDRSGIGECLERLAEVARAQGLPRRAARLAGAAESFHERATTSRPAGVNAGKGDAAPGIESGRGQSELDAARAAGRGMTLEQVLEYARSTETAAGSPTISGSPLTRREQEIAALIARGMTNRQMAKALVITEGTVANHVQHILNKLGFDSRAQIAVWATQSGLHPPAEK